MVSHPGFADQQDLLRWAGTLPAKSQLPALIRRLVLETGDGVARVDFPAAEGVAVGGWDGVAVAAGETAFVPGGLSLWELSAGKRTTAKADADYAKRVEAPDGSPTVDSTYCAVSVQRWRDRRTWAATRARDGRWKAVRAYGVDDLEAWLDSAPVTHAWISEVLGLQPHGMRTPTAWWEPWAVATDPPLTPELVIAGRDGEARRLLEVLRGPPQVTTLRGGSPDEVLGVITAVLLLDEADGGDLLARTLFVDEVAAWRRLGEQRRELILVPRGPAVIAESRAAARHHVVVPVIGTADADIELPSLDAAAASEALRALGVHEGRANEVGALGRRSFLALRRNLAANPELHTPAWATPPVSRAVRATLLAGKWHDSADGDRERLAQLAGVDYDDLREQLVALAAGEDPYLIRSGETWSLVSPYDAWRQLRRRVTPEDLERFACAVPAVLCEEDPAFGIAPLERWRATLEGKSRRHSPDLREGLATTQALLGAVGQDVDAGRASTGATLAARLVRLLLGAANDDATGARWAGLSAQLELLAEASPDAFLDGVRGGLAEDPPVVMTLFQDGEGFDVLFSSSAHTWLLWGLEVAAWSPDHVGQAVDLVARLAELDPGGRMANRPAATLDAIFCPWHPETTAGVERRLDLIDVLRRRHPGVAWDLMLELLPDTHDIHSPTAAPRFRDWKPSQYSVTRVQWFEFVRALVPRLVEDAGDNPVRWQRLIAESTSLLPSDRATVRDGLAGRLDAGRLPEQAGAALWEELRALIARHRSYADTDWALPEEELRALETITDRLAPVDLVEQHIWLFTDDFPELGDDSNFKDGEYDHATYTAALDVRRREAVRAILDAESWHGVLRAADRAERDAGTGAASALGWSAAKIDGGSHDGAALELLATGQRETLATGYLAARFSSEGWPWLERWLKGRPPTLQATLLLITRDYPASWERADALGSDVAAAYWQGFQPFGLGSPFEPAGQVARRLLDAGRPATALQLLNLYLFRDRAASPEEALTAAEALEALLRQSAERGDLGGLRRHEMQQAFAFLERHTDTVGVDRVARLEWSYLPALGSHPRVPSLHGALTADPSLFVELVSSIYRRRNAESDAPVSSDQQQRARNAYELLSSWKRPPGTSPGGELDGQTLRDWVDAVLPLLDEADRRDVGEEHIGMVLAAAPADSDGVWPARGVRDLLEDLQRDRLEAAIARGRYNSRGTTSRDPTERGDQERALADALRSDAQRLADRWPRTAAVLRSLAESFEADARRYDEEAERRRKGLDS